MNASIIIAEVSVGIMVFARLFMGVLVFLSGSVSVLAVVLPVAVAVLILIGILMGQRLAWQWGRLLGLFGAISLTLGAYGAFVRAGRQPEYTVLAVLLALQGLPLFPMFFALGTRGRESTSGSSVPSAAAPSPRAAISSSRRRSAANATPRGSDRCR